MSSPGAAMVNPVGGGGSPAVRCLGMDSTRRRSLFVARTLLNQEIIDVASARLSRGSWQGEEPTTEQERALRIDLQQTISRCSRLQEQVETMRSKAEKSAEMYDNLISALQDRGVLVGDLTIPSSAHRSSSSSPLPKSRSTIDVNRIVSTLIAQDLKEQRLRLPQIEGFLDKLSPRKSFFSMRMWQNRYFYISNNSLCYSRDRIECTQSDDSLRWQMVNEIPLLSIRCISPAIDGRDRQFIIDAADWKDPGTEREYVFRAKNKGLRDMWLHGIQAHVQHSRDVVRLGSLQQQGTPTSNTNIGNL